MYSCSQRIFGSMKSCFIFDLWRILARVDVFNSDKEVDDSAHRMFSGFKIPRV